MTKIQVFTSVVNRPDFLELQARLFRQYLTDMYQFNVIDDSIEPKMQTQFQSIADEHGITYYRKPTRYDKLDAAVACAETIQWAYDTIIRSKHRDDIVLFLDSDMFLIDHFSVKDYIDSHLMGGWAQYREHVEYIWNGTMFLNMPKIIALDEKIDFSCGLVDDILTDVGGRTYYYFRKYNVSFKKYTVNWPDRYKRKNLKKETGGYNFEFHVEDKFLHYRSATNWHTNGYWRNRRDPLTKKRRLFSKIIKKCLKGKPIVGHFVMGDSYGPRKPSEEYR